MIVNNSLKTCNLMSPNCILQKFERIRSYSPYCVGTLVNSRWILSAAHCYVEDKNNNLSDYLAVGGIDQLTNFDNKEIQKSEIKAIVTKNYDPELHSNDIALLKLQTPMEETSAVDFVKLPLQSFFPEDISMLYQQCTTAGWGVVIPISVMGLARPLTREDYPDHLMCVNLPLINFTQCQAIFDEKAVDIIISDTQMCTLYVKGRRDSCIGDSGGPLLCGSQQYGITSWGLGCAQLGYPGVFTRTDRYVNWIRSISGTKRATKLLGRSKSIRTMARACQMQTCNLLRTLNLFHFVLFTNFGSTTFYFI